MIRQNFHSSLLNSVSRRVKIPLVTSGRYFRKGVSIKAPEVRVWEALEQGAEYVEVGTNREINKYFHSSPIASPVIHLVVHLSLEINVQQGDCCPIFCELFPEI